MLGSRSRLIQQSWFISPMGSCTGPSQAFARSLWWSMSTFLLSCLLLLFLSCFFQLCEKAGKQADSQGPWRLSQCHLARGFVDMKAPSLILCLQICRSLFPIHPTPGSKRAQDYPRPKPISRPCVPVTHTHTHPICGGCWVRLAVVLADHRCVRQNAGISRLPWVKRSEKSGSHCVVYSERAQALTVICDGLKWRLFFNSLNFATANDRGNGVNMSNSTGVV